MRFLILALIFISAPINMARAEEKPEKVSVLGLRLVPGSEEISENRYVSPKDFKKTVRHFLALTWASSKIKMKDGVNLVGIKYVHFSNSDPKSEWEGVNVYEIKNGEVRQYVIPRQTADASSLKPTEPSSGQQKYQGAG